MVRDMNSSGLTLDFEFQVENKTPIGCRIVQLQYDLKLNGARFARGTAARDIVIKANGKSKVRVPYTIRFKDVFGTIDSLISSKTHLPYDLSLAFAVTTSVGVVKVKGQANGTVNLKRKRSAFVGPGRDLNHLL